VINTIWAACKSDEYVPDNVFWVINEQINAEIIETVKDWTSEILVVYGVKKPMINDTLIDETDGVGFT